VADGLPRHDLRHADGRLLSVYGGYDGQPLPVDAPAAPPPSVHLRHDALTDTWVAISPARNTRPDDDPRAAVAAAPPRPRCPLCPGGPEVPFAYDAAVFENRWPTLVADPPPPPLVEGPTAPARGRCEVVLYTSTHEGSLATLTGRELAGVVAIWADRARGLWADRTLRYVLPFENRGSDVGATLPHPHGQIYALDHLPVEAKRRRSALVDHRASHGRCLTCEVVATDGRATDRTLLDNPSFVVAVPFAPDWPFEVHVRARRHGLRRLGDLTATERHDLAVALRAVVRTYDRVQDVPMSYLMAVQEAPRDDDGEPVDDWHLAVEFRPPNRAPDKLKLRASVETFAGFFINDTCPEVSAATLAAVDTGPALDVDDAIPDVEVVRAERRSMPSSSPR
jgi:UDPglucose--hexose-1-phosphate uridylyltransferase